MNFPDAICITLSMNKIQTTENSIHIASRWLLRKGHRKVSAPPILASPQQASRPSTVSCLLQNRHSYCSFLRNRHIRSGPRLQNRHKSAVLHVSLSATCTKALCTALASPKQAQKYSALHLRLRNRHKSAVRGGGWPPIVTTIRYVQVLYFHIVTDSSH